MLRGQKDCGMIARAPLALIIRLEPNVSPLIQIICLVVKTLAATLASYAAK